MDSFTICVMIAVFLPLFVTAIAFGLFDEESKTNRRLYNFMYKVKYNGHYVHLSFVKNWARVSVIGPNRELILFKGKLSKSGQLYLERHTEFKDGRQVFKGYEKFCI